MQKILVIEDEQAIADTVMHCIEREGYAATWCTEGAAGLACVSSGDFSLVVLDVGLPDINGFELCRTIRTFSTIPIIFLTARDDEIDTIVGLEIGGDDYVTKPFSPRELGARIKSVLRRTPQGTSPVPPSAQHAAQTSEHSLAPHLPQTPPPKVLATLVIDKEKMVAHYHGSRLDLTRYEFGLLALLAEHPGKVYSREALMECVWGTDTPSLDRTVDTHVKSLRAKCRDVHPAVDPILTHRGTGYALREDL